MVSSSSKSSAGSLHNPSVSAAYDFTAISTALGEADGELDPSTSSTAAFDMTGLSEALGEGEQRQRLASLVRLHERIRQPKIATKVVICKVPTFKFSRSKFIGEHRRAHMKEKKSRTMERLRMETEEMDRIFSSLMNDRTRTG